jgi:hypothetical protein
MIGGFMGLRFVGMFLSLIVMPSAFSYSWFPQYEILVKTCVESKKSKPCNEAYELAKVQSSVLDDKYLEIMANKQSASLSIESSVEQLKAHQNDVRRFNRLTMKLQATPHWKFTKYIQEAQRAMSFQGEYIDQEQTKEAQAWNNAIKDSYGERAKLQAVGWLDRVRYK